MLYETKLLVLVKTLVTNILGNLMSGPQTKLIIDWAKQSVLRLVGISLVLAPTIHNTATWNVYIAAIMADFGSSHHNQSSY